MKIKLFCLSLIVGVFGFINLSFNQYENNLSDLTLGNIEALANGEKEEPRGYNIVSMEKEEVYDKISNTTIVVIILHCSGNGDLECKQI